MSGRLQWPVRSMRAAIAVLALVTNAVAELASLDNVVHYTLVVTTCHLSIGDVSTWTRCYNGTVPGPTLRVKQGQTLSISLINTLSDDENTEWQIMNITGYKKPLSVLELKERYNKTSFEEARGTGSLFGAANTTNLHMHGLVVSAASPADDVLMHVGPGKVGNYRYQVLPSQMGGTGWYHPHHHHSTAGQAHGGMFGAFIVEDPPSSLPSEILGAEDRLILVDTLDVKLQRAVARMSMDNLWQTDSNATVTLVNGTLEPSSAVQSGKWYRLRFVYASMFHSVRLALKSDSATCQMGLLAKDSVYLNEAPRVVKRIWLAAGNRADVMVSCSCNGAASCKATFSSEWGPRDVAERNNADAHWNGIALTRTWVGDVFHLDITGEVVADALPVFQPKMPCYLADLTALNSAQLSPGNKVDVTMNWAQTVQTGLRGEDAEAHDSHYHNMIKGQFYMTFNHSFNRMMSDDQKAVATLPFDEVQEWTVKGTQYHPFHVHGQPYQIVAMPSKAELMDTLITHNVNNDVSLSSYLNETMVDLIEDDDGWFQIGDWADTFHDLGSQVVVRVAPRIPDLATMVFHCHYLNHEDQGMMTYVDIEPGGSTCTKGAQCAKALDPQCYSDSAGAGFTLKGKGRSLRR